MMVVNRGKGHLQCGDKPQPQRSVIFDVMHKSFFVYFPLLPFDLSCLMYRRVTVHLCGSDANPVCLTDLQFIYLKLFIQTFFFFYCDSKLSKVESL